MNSIKKLWMLPLATVVFLAFCNNVNTKPENELLQTIMSRLEHYHFQPRKIDDNFSKQVFDNFIESTDNNKLFFLKSDIKAFEIHKTNIDDQIKAGDIAFMTQVWDSFENRLKSAKGWYQEILSKPFDFNTDETLETDEKKSDFSKNETERYNLWRKTMKLATLEKLYHKLDIQKKALEKKDSAIKQYSFDSLEFKSRAEVLKSYTEWYKRLEKFDHKDKLNAYINSITELFDPHSNFFPPVIKKNFDIQMSGQFDGIGATLSEREGYIKVESIVVGSASYKQGELKEGDMIMKVGQADAEAVDVVNMKLDDAIQLIRGKKGTEVRLTVKRTDGTIKVIPIIRDKVVIEEGFAKSVIYETGTKKIGVIKLPSFYSSFNRREGHKSADDVRLELEKLKAEGVNGVVLDLRNNGGGSLGDAVEMAGLFIKKGPIVQIKTSGGKLDVLEDPDEDVVYSGPLVVLVNENSASASEILAAAIQDYKRGIIMGTKSTHGKGTVQTFFNLGDNPYEQNDADGSVKITIQKFYRINGGTTQLKGVTPDIIMPSNYDYIEYGEKELHFALGFDQIKSAVYETTNEVDKYKDVMNASNARIKNNPLFKAVESNAKTIGDDRKHSVMPLSLAKYEAFMKAEDIENKTYTEAVKAAHELKLQALKADINSITGDSSKLKQATEWFKGYKKDFVLEEAFNVLNEVLG